MLKRVKKLVFKYKVYILGIFCLGLIWDIFFNPQIFDLAVLSLLFLWILTVFNFKFKPKASFILATISYGISFVFQFFNKEMIVEKGVSWFFLFLLVGLVQAFISTAARRKPPVSVLADESPSFTKIVRDSTATKEETPSGSTELTEVPRAGGGFIRSSTKNGKRR